MPQRQAATGVSACVTAAQQQFVDTAGVTESFAPAQGLLEAQAQRHEHAVVPPPRPLTLMGEIPLAEVEQARGLRLHAVDRAVLEAKAVTFQQGGNACRFVTATVPHEFVECRPG